MSIIRLQFLKNAFTTKINLLFNTTEKHLYIENTATNEQTKLAIITDIKTKLTELSDMPDYTGKGGYVMRIKDDESGIELLPNNLDGGTF